MYLDSEFAKPISSFQRPVDPPDIDPNTGDQITVCFNELWRPYVVGALTQLLLQSTWNTDTVDLDTTQGRVFNLIDMFRTAHPGCGVTPPFLLCISGSFADDDYGFSSALSANCVSTYVGGTGWESCHFSGNDTEYVTIERAFDNQTYIRSFKFDLHFDAAPVTQPITVTFFLHGSVVYTQTFTFTPVHDVTVSDDVNQQCDFVYIEAHQDAVLTDTITIKGWELCYTGDFPLTQAPGEVCKVFDFAASDQGFVVWTERPYGFWATGGWFQQNNQVGNSSIYIGKPFDFGGVITSITLEFDTEFSDGNDVSISHEFNDNTFYTPGAGHVILNTGTINWHVTAGERFLFNLLNSTHHPSTLQIEKVTICSTTPLFS